MKRFENTNKLVCLNCGESPEVLLNVKGLYYCESCNEANKKRDRWEREEHLWNGKETDDWSKDLQHIDLEKLKSL